MLASTAVFGNILTPLRAHAANSETVSSEAESETVSETTMVGIVNPEITPKAQGPEKTPEEKAMEELIEESIIRQHLAAGGAAGFTTHSGAGGSSSRGGTRAATLKMSDAPLVISAATGNDIIIKGDVAYTDSYASATEARPSNVGIKIPITVEANFSGTITLDGVNIKFDFGTGAANEVFPVNAVNIVNGADVNMIIKGTNRLEAVGGKFVEGKALLHAGGVGNNVTRLTLSSFDGQDTNAHQLIAKSGVVPDIAGIGGNKGENGGIITINSGYYQIDSGDNAAGIGGGYQGGAGTITINGGNIRSYNDSGSKVESGAGIGGGVNYQGSAANWGSITITGGTIDAASRTSAGQCGAGIGAGTGTWSGNEFGTILITGGTIRAEGNGVEGVGIGGGKKTSKGRIIILPQANVTAVGNAAGTDIGNAEQIFYINEQPARNNFVIGGGSGEAVPFKAHTVDNTKNAEVYGKIYIATDYSNAIGAYLGNTGASGILSTLSNGTTPLYYYSSGKVNFFTDAVHAPSTPKRYDSVDLVGFGGAAVDISFPVPLGAGTWGLDVIGATVVDLPNKKYELNLGTVNVGYTNSDIVSKSFQLKNTGDQYIKMNHNADAINAAPVFNIGGDIYKQTIIEGVMLPRDSEAIVDVTPKVGLAFGEYRIPMTIVAELNGVPTTYTVTLIFNVTRATNNAAATVVATPLPSNTNYYGGGQKVQLTATATASGDSIDELWYFVSAAPAAPGVVSGSWVKSDTGAIKGNIPWPSTTTNGTYYVHWKAVTQKFIATGTIDSGGVKNYKVDATAPTGVITSVPTHANGPFKIEITYNDPLSGLDGAQVIDTSKVTVTKKGRLLPRHLRLVEPMLREWLF